MKKPLGVLTPIPVPKEAGLYYRADLEYCPSCKKACTIDIDRVEWTVESDSENNPKFEEAVTPIVESLWISPEHFARIETVLKKGAIRL